MCLCLAQAAVKPSLLILYMWTYFFRPIWTEPCRQTESDWRQCGWRGGSETKRDITWFCLNSMCVCARWGCMTRLCHHFNVQQLNPYSDDWWGTCPLYPILHGTNAGLRTKTKERICPRPQHQLPHTVDSVGAALLSDRPEPNKRKKKFRISIIIPHWF